jgi:hypothetical protein
MAFNNSTHKFTDPIRVFKANDPYHFVIDNLPLQQLMENDRWLKDQIDFVQEVATSSNEGIDRSGFNELKPFANGTDNVIHVNPGQYHSRINDAYSVSSLQKVRLANNFIPGQFRQYTGFLSTSAFNDFVANLQGSLESNSMNLNGLSERVFQLQINNPDSAKNYTIVNGNPAIENAESGYQWPLLNAAPFLRTFITSEQGSFADLAKLSAEFIKMYRGVGRMSIVNIDEELEIEIPPFDANDFKVNGANTTATSRIDLVFIYSHPIDANATTINSFTNGSPRIISKPTLGILKGAGAVFTTATNINNPNTVTEAVDEEGNSQILANAADENNPNNGFKVRNIHGSFPLPEDLMNLAPNLIEGLETSSFQLIGQTIFPVCYVRVKADANINVGGSQVITNNDIIDIRPFFKTNELTYNERAGILMASPPLSPANPAVGQFQLDYQLNSIFNQLNTRITSVQQGSPDLIVPRVVGGGVIWGGTKFGPEGAIRVARRYYFNEESPSVFTEAPVLPDWDLAEYWQMNPPSEDSDNRGQRRNDYINSWINGNTIDGVAPTYSLAKDFREGAGTTYFDTGTGSTSLQDFNSLDRRIGTEAYHYGAGGINDGGITIHWCKKEILIDRVSVPWMVDYTVDCTLENCIWQSSRNGIMTEHNQNGKGGTCGIWVERKSDRFIIYVSWIGNHPGQWGGDYKQYRNTGHGIEPRNNRDAFGYSGFVVRTSDLGNPTSNNNYFVGKKPNKFNSLGIDSDNFQNTGTKSPRMGSCTYPTISFKVTGYPSSYFNKALAQNPQTASITLK